MDKVSLDYISDAIDELVDLFGLKEPVNSEMLLKLLEDKEIKKCIKEIAYCLGLPVEINLFFVTDGGDTINFETSSLVKTDYRGVGSNAIIAQVLIPKNIPQYGSSALINFPIKVKVNKNCVTNPNSFISIIAHELSHILLASHGSIQSDNEIYTDLTPLIHGFSKIVIIGRKIEDVKITKDYNVTSTVTHTTTNTTTYGYLNDEQFNFAIKKLNQIHNKNLSEKEVLLKKLVKFKNIYNLCIGYLNVFKQLLDLLQLSKNIKYKQNDGVKIASFYNPAYLININSALEKNKVRLEKLNSYYDNFKIFSKHNLEILRMNTLNTEDFTFQLESSVKELKNNLYIILKYVAFFNKLKIFVSLTNLKVKSFF